MKDYLKDITIIIGIVAGILLGSYVAWGAPTSTILQNLILPNLTSQNCIGTNGSGLVGNGTCGGGSGLTTGADGQVIIGVLGGNGTSTNVLTVNTSTRQLTIGNLAAGTNCVNEANGVIGTTAGNCSSGSGFNNGVDTQLLFGVAGGSASSSNLLTFVSSTGALILNASTSIANASTTGNVTIGGTFQSNAGHSQFGAVSSTNLGLSGTLYLSVNCNAGDFYTQSTGGNVRCATPAGSAFNSGVDSQLLFGQLGGGATSSNRLTFNTSTLVLNLGTGSTGLFNNFVQGKAGYLIGSSGVNGNCGTFQNDSTDLWSLGWGSACDGTLGTKSVTWGEDAASNVIVGINKASPVAVLDVAASGGTNDTFRVGNPNQVGIFTINGNLASSTEFRSPSSTIDTLTVGTCIGCPAGGSGVQSLPSSTAWIDGNLLFGQAGGTATSSNLFTISTTTGQLTVGSSSLANVSSTNITTGNLQITGTCTGCPGSVFNAGVDSQVLFGQLGGGATSSQTFNLISSSTVQIKGFTNQTTDLLQITSSTGQKFFTISPMGIASSSNFYAASSTLNGIVSLGAAATLNGGTWGATASNHIIINGNVQNAGGAETSNVAFQQSNSVSTAPNAGVNSSFMKLTGTFQPTSGAGGWIGLQLAHTFDQSTCGVCGGTTRSIYINPVLTAAADYRAFEEATATLTLSSSTVTQNNAITWNLIGAPTLIMASTTKSVTASTFTIMGAPNSTSTAKIGLTIVSSTALAIQGTNLASTTNAYSLWVDPPKGATNNYVASFNNGMTNSTGTSPTPSSCGTGTPKVTGTDGAGHVTVGGGTQTTCTITFVTPKANPPVCIFQVDTGNFVINVTTTISTAVFTSNAGNMANATAQYICHSID